MIMRKTFLLLLIFMTGVFSVHSQSFGFSDSTKISLITCEPGKVLYAKFGHTAIRIQDDKGLDLVFNYGVFDFKTKGFYWKFLRGHTDYVLAVYPFAYFVQDYIMRNSSVWEQVLNLNKEEKDKLIELLTINYQPENRMYRYNFVYDNCSTRPYDIISKSIQGVVKIDENREIISGREMINNYIEDSPWAMVGINLIFGLESDKKMLTHTQTFLPEYLQDILQTATFFNLDDNQAEVLIVHEVNKLVDAYPEEKQAISWLFHPSTIMILLLLIGFMLILFYRDMDHISHKIFDTFLFLLIGIGGTIIFFLMFFSEHPFVGRNLNILWMNPINLVLAAFVWIKSTRKTFFFYNIFYLISIIISYIAIAFFTHSAILEIIPLQALVLLRILWREERLFHVLLEPSKRGLRWKE